MIQDLSRTLQTILSQPGLPAPLKNALIAFDRPEQSFKPLQTTVDLFLYDLRENLELRSNELTIDKGNTQAVTHKAPMRLACSYLATAWPVGGADPALQEQQLLSQVLQALARFPTIPGTFLQGLLVGQTPPLPMVALHPDALKNLAEFWSSLGNSLRASLTVTVTIRVPVFADVTEFLVTSATTNATAGNGSADSWLQFGGRVFDPSANGVPGALADLLDTGLRTRTDDDGRFVFSGVQAGSHTLRIVATGFQPLIQSVIVPGDPGNFQVSLTPL
jgi:Pvc16 N-terminal domain/Carboxypeptidase regulatory-like domain